MEEDSQSIIDPMDTLDAYLEAAEMYLNAIKLGNDSLSLSIYTSGMKAVYYGRAYVAFSSSDDQEATKGSLRLTLVTFDEFIKTYGKTKTTEYFIDTCALIMKVLRTEMRKH
jgi:hypothetical protein